MASKTTFMQEITDEITLNSIEEEYNGAKLIASCELKLYENIPPMDIRADYISEGKDVKCHLYMSDPSEILSFNAHEREYVIEDADSEAFIAAMKENGDFLENIACEMSDCFYDDIMYDRNCERYFTVLDNRHTPT